MNKQSYKFERKILAQFDNFCLFDTIYSQKNTYINLLSHILNMKNKTMINHKKQLIFYKSKSALIVCCIAAFDSLNDRYPPYCAEYRL